MLIDIKTVDDPNIIGEYLRNKCFINQNDDSFDLQHMFNNLDNSNDKKKEIARIIQSQSFPSHDDVVYIDTDYESDDDDRSLDERIQDELIALNTTYVATDGEITCAWNEDGDGVLLFEIEDGPTVINYDCKKSRDWKFVELIK